MVVAQLSVEATTDFNLFEVDVFRNELQSTMSKRLKAKAKTKRRSGKNSAAAAPAADFSRLEFYRNAVALMPDPADRPKPKPGRHYSTFQ
jgi:hypothetical protein